MIWLKTETVTTLHSLLSALIEEIHHQEADAKGLARVGLVNLYDEAASVQRCLGAAFAGEYRRTPCRPHWSLEAIQQAWENTALKAMGEDEATLRRLWPQMVDELDRQVNISFAGTRCDEGGA